jgi:hypothetical protein
VVSKGVVAQTLTSTIALAAVALVRFLHSAHAVQIKPR